MLIFATGIAVFAVLKYFPEESELDQRYAICAAAVTSACLGDLGFAEASHVSSLPRYVREISQMGQIGHLAEAHALEFRIQEASGLPLEAAKVAADRRFASLRITAAIRAGKTVRQAFDQTPQADGGALWISALDLLGRSPYGMSAHPKSLPDAVTRLYVAEIAELIFILAQREKNPRAATSYLVYAAELQAMLQDSKAAATTLAHLPAEGHEGMVLSDELLQVIGAEFAVPLCGQVVECEIWTRIRLAVAAGDAASARDDLEQRFTALADQKPWPDFRKMEEVVVLAAQGGDHGEALVLARRLLETAKTKPDVFPVFAFIRAARALEVAGADADEVRQSLNLAEAGFPQNPKAIVGFGFNSGPIQWGGFGLEAQARREIANTLARLGDLDAAKTMMKGIEDPAFAWRDMLTPDIPVTLLDPLLRTAGDAMSSDDFAYVRACLAQDLVLADPSDLQAAWAKATATDILRADFLASKRASITYQCLSRVGYFLKNGAGITVPNVIPAPPALDPVDRALIRRANGAGPKDVVVIATGRLSPQKDPLLLIRAFAAAQAKVENLVLWMVGDGALRREAEALAASLLPSGDPTNARIRFLGARDDVPRLLPAADIFALSSLWEGLPVALLEAMAAGLSIACTRVGDIPEFLPEDAALIVQPGDETGFAGALARLAEDPALRQTLSTQALDAVAAHCDVDGWKKTLEQIYAELA